MALYFVATEGALKEGDIQPNGRVHDFDPDDLAEEIKKVWEESQDVGYVQTGADYFLYPLEGGCKITVEIKVGTTVSDVSEVTPEQAMDALRSLTHR